MSHNVALISEHQLGASNRHSISLSIVQPNSVGKTSPLHYPVQPYRPAGNFYSCLPSDRYKTIIAYYCQVHVMKDARERTIFPTGTAALVFRCSHHKPGGFLVGTPTSPREPEYVIRGCEYFVVWFWPGMSYAFCPLAAKELTDTFLSLDELLGGESERLTERMVLAKTFQARIRVFERFMDWHSRQLHEVPKNLSSIIATICREVSQVDEEEFRSCAYYTDRHIRRLFQTYVGISPHLFKRIMRHQYTLRALTVRPNQGIAILATEYGHYDQSHLIREFETFMGLTPIQFINNLYK